MYGGDKRAIEEEEEREGKRNVAVTVQVKKRGRNLNSIITTS